MTTDIELALAKGKVEGARKLLQEYYEAQDKQEFEAKIRDEYYKLFPKYRDMTDNEIHNYDDKYLMTDTGAIVVPELFEYPKVEIDYSEDENYLTFEEYKNETRVVSEATHVCDECQLALDNELCINNKEHQTRLIPEVTELVRPYIAKDVTDRINEYLKSKYAELRAKAYPPMEMFADAWVKNDTEAMEEYRRLCLEVKERFPK